MAASGDRVLELIGRADGARRGPIAPVVPNRYAQFLDIAGAVTEDIDGKEFLTVAGVALLPELVDTARLAIPQGFPKWRDSMLADAAKAIELINGFALTALTVRIRREPQAWKRFWKDAKSYRDKLATEARGKSGFLKAANLIKFWLFGECSGRLLGESLKRVGRPSLTDGKGLQVAEVSVVCDSDIQGEENIATFKDLWEVAERSQVLLPREGLAHATRSVDLLTEQQEPILLLPDYLAGLVHTCSQPRAVTPPPGLSANDVETLSAALDRLACLARVEVTFDMSHAEIFGAR